MGSMATQESSAPGAGQQFTTPADVRSILREELRDHFEVRVRERELDLVTRVIKVETTMEFLAKQMVEGFERVDQRFEELIHQMDRRFEQVDKRFEQTDKRFEDMYRHMDNRFEQVDKRFTLVQWVMGIGFTMITVLMSVYQFLV